MYPEHITESLQVWLQNLFEGALSRQRISHTDFARVYISINEQVSSAYNSFN